MSKTKSNLRSGNADSNQQGKVDSRWDRAAILFLIVTTVIRLFQLSATNLVPDEAYYWDWSRRPSLGYYDQGPFIAYLIRTTTALFGTNEFGVRIGVLLCSLGAVVLAGMVARRCFSPLAGFLTVVLLGSTPLMEVGSIIATYDPPLVFFWMLSVLLIERALFGGEGEKVSVRYWLLAGVSTGFGLLSKHTMLLIAPGLILYLALNKRHRRWLARPEPYLAFGICLLMYSGVIIWNAQHHWWTFGHLLFLTSGAKGKPEPLKHLGDYLASQALLVGPVLFFGTFSGFSGLRQRLRALMTGDFDGVPEGAQQAGRQLYLMCMGWPTLAFFLLLSLKTKVQGNWAVFAWLTPAILWSGIISAKYARAADGKIRRRSLSPALSSFVLAGVLSVVMVFPAIAFRLGLKLKPDNDQTNQFVGWRETVDRVQQVRQEMSSGPDGKQHRPVFIVGSGYQYPAMLGFYLPDRPETFDMFLHFRLDMYAAYVEHLTARLGQDAVFINENQTEDADLRKVFTEVTWDPPLPIYRKPYYAGPIRTVYIARCRGYRLYTGTSWHVGG